LEPDFRVAECTFGQVHRPLESQGYFDRVMFHEICREERMMIVIQMNTAFMGMVRMGTPKKDLDMPK
jgi:hypothetical protein